MLRIQDLASRRNGQTLLNGVTLDVPDGHTVLLTGDAGGGKNALLRIVGGLEKYSRGTIVFDDLPTRADQLRHIAFLTSKGTLPPFLSAAGVAEFAAFLWTGFDAEEYTIRIQKMDIPQGLPLSKLTPFERSCIELTCGMVRGCCYLLLDSSFCIDARTAWLAMQTVLTEFPDSHPTILIASSQWKDWCAHVDRAIWMAGGRQCADVCVRMLPEGQKLSEALREAVRQMDGLSPELIE